MKKNLRHLRNLRDLKNVPRKICVYLWNLWDFLHSQGISFLRGIILSHRFHRYTQIFYGISGESLCPISGGICNDRTGRLCEISVSNRRSRKSPNKSRVIRWKKICVICEICVTKKTSQEKSVYICEICGTFSNLRGVSFLRGIIFVPQISQIYTDFLWNLWWIALSNLRGYLQRPNRSHLRNSVSNRRSKKYPNKFRVIRWKKSASSAKSAWLKKRPKKNLCISVKSVGQKNNITGLQCSYFVRPSSPNVLS